MTLRLFQTLPVSYDYDLMYAELAWVLVSLGTKVQLQIILDPDYLPDNLSVSYDYGKSSYF